MQQASALGFIAFANLRYYCTNCQHSTGTIFTDGNSHVGNSVQLPSLNNVNLDALQQKVHDISNQLSVLQGTLNSLASNAVINDHVESETSIPAVGSSVSFANVATKNLHQVVQTAVNRDF
jgi:hypothetical protein